MTDINEHLRIIAESLINSLKADLSAELKNKISDEVISKLAVLELGTIVNNTIKTELNNKLVQINLVDLSTKELSRVVNATTDYINKSLIDSAKNQIVADVSSKLSNININDVVNSVVTNHLNLLLENLTFPDNSIPHSSIDFTGVKFTGDLVRGGIIENFGSTGIEDRSTFVQLTLMDHATVFEGPIYSPEIQVKGNASVDGSLTVSGNLIILGEIDSGSPAYKALIKHSSEQTQELLKLSLNDNWFADYSRVIFNEIKENGLDLNRITQDDKEIIKGNQLGYHITDTNIQRLGHVVDLQTRGETLLSDTFYVTKNRAGVNTLDPSAAFVVWDEECEIVVAKRKQDTGYIGTSRNQNVILGSNNKDNIVLNTDGTTVVSQLTLNKIPMTSSNEMPSYNAPLGQIVFNETPTVGNFIGWVSLGGARWAPFGKIE